MRINQFEVWIADLSPQIGTEPGKTRPVLIVQSDLLNQVRHPSTIICPITSKVKKDADILRIHLAEGIAGLNQDCNIMLDQIRAIDNIRLMKKIGSLPTDLVVKTKENIKICLDLT